MINPVETESMPDETIHGLSERLEQMTGQYQEPEMYPDTYAENGSEPSAYEAYEQALPEETVEQDMEQDAMKRKMQNIRSQRLWEMQKKQPGYQDSRTRKSNGISFHHCPY